MFKHYRYSEGNRVLKVGDLSNPRIITAIKKDSGYWFDKWLVTLDNTEIVDGDDLVGYNPAIYQLNNSIKELESKIKKLEDKIGDSDVTSCLINSLDAVYKSMFGDFNFNPCETDVKQDNKKQPSILKKIEKLEEYLKIKYDSSECENIEKYTPIKITKPVKKNTKKKK